MGIKPGPKRIAVSTGKPDRRQRDNKKYRQLHPENPELDDYDVMEEEIYRWLFKTIDELPPRCKKIFLLHLDGKKQRETKGRG